MYRIPQYILENLRCSVCEGYLSSKPLMLKADSKQICGKCFKILPAKQKEKCYRQIGLESLAEVLIFPCRYNTFGCSFTYSWCDEKDHEAECSFRYKTLSTTTISSTTSDNIYYNASSSRNTIQCESEDIKAVLQYEIKDHKYSYSKNLEYALRITGSGDKTLSLNRENARPLEDLELCIEGVVSLGPSPEALHTEVKVKQLWHENVYESVKAVEPNRMRCLNCKSVVNDDKNTCLFGHISCENCKGKMCVMCVKIMEKDSRSFCKNYDKGCTDAMDDVNKHQGNCQYNDVQCPIEPCNEVNVLAKIKVHLKEDHADKVILSHEVSKTFQNKDEKFIIYCYDGIFKCVYYYYKSFVEFFVTYIGSSEEAVKYTYEIGVSVNGKSTTKKSKCSNWNDVLLEKGIMFDRKDLLGSSQKKLKFEAVIKIAHRSK